MFILQNIGTNMVTSTDLTRFYSFFSGKKNSYVKNDLPKTKNNNEEKVKTKIYTVEAEVDKHLMASHLKGDFGVGICPITEEGKCKFAVIDIDCYIQSKIKISLNMIRDYQLPLLPFRSKSGGLHLYIFFSKAVSANTARDLLKQIIESTALNKIYGENKVETFPKQDKLKGFGSCITLPYFNEEETYNPMVSLSGESLPLKQALEIIQNNVISVDKVKELIDSLPYNDAPPCIQKLLISRNIGSENSGRNNFLFSFAVYAKKKYASGFEDVVKKVNEEFESPLDEEEVENICSSVSNNEYIYKCSDIPCKEYCNKITCKKREFGLGRDKGHFTGVDYGKLYRYKAAEPYYIWELRLQGQEKWVNVVFKDEAYLLEQRNFARMCVRYLNIAPMQVSNNDWYNILNSVLPNVIDVEVSKESDTSHMSVIRNAFFDYLASKRAWKDAPYQIRLGICVRISNYNGAKYYFTHAGFEKYLKAQKIDFDSATLRETLISFGAKEDVLVYTNAQDREIRFACWSKEEDEIITTTVEGKIEIEEGDKKLLLTGEVGQLSEFTDLEQSQQEKPYSKEDYENAKEML